VKVLTNSLIAAIALGVCAPMYANVILANAVVDGALGENLNGTPMQLFDTGAPNGSPISDTVNWNFACSTCTGYGISGNGAAKVINGALGASSSLTVTGSPGVFLGLADTYADYFDELTINGGTGTGVLQLQYTVDGVISQTGTGPNVDSFAFLSNLFASSYQVDGGPITSGTEADFFGNGTTNSTVTFYLPFTYGTAFASELHLEAAAGFASSSSDLTPYTSTADFYNTATLNSALVFDGTTLNTGAQIGSASGLGYGPTGISAAPEPGTWFLVASAIGVLILVKRRGALWPTR
jgi:hypothetical protein